MKRTVAVKDEAACPAEPEAKRAKTEEEANADSVLEFDLTDFECVVCYDLLVDPVVGKCGHDFCKACLEDWRHKQHTGIAAQYLSTTCPVCRKDVGLNNPRARARGEPDELGVCIRLKHLIEKLFPRRSKERRKEVEAENEVRKQRRQQERQEQQQRQAQYAHMQQGYDGMHFIGGAYAHAGAATTLQGLYASMGMDDPLLHPISAVRGMRFSEMARHSTQRLAASGIGRDSNRDGAAVGGVSEQQQLRRSGRLRAVATSHADSRLVRHNSAQRAYEGALQSGSHNPAQRAYEGALQSGSHNPAQRAYEGALQSGNSRDAARERVGVRTGAYAAAAGAAAAATPAGNMTAAGAGGAGGAATAAAGRPASVNIPTFLLRGVPDPAPDLAGLVFEDVLYRNAARVPPIEVDLLRASGAAADPAAEAAHHRQLLQAYTQIHWQGAEQEQLLPRPRRETQLPASRSYSRGAGAEEGRDAAGNLASRYPLSHRLRQLHREQATHLRRWRERIVQGQTQLLDLLDAGPRQLQAGEEQQGRRVQEPVDEAAAAAADAAMRPDNVLLAAGLSNDGADSGAVAAVRNRAESPESPRIATLFDDDEGGFWRPPGRSRGACDAEAVERADMIRRSRAIAATGQLQAGVQGRLTARRRAWADADVAAQAPAAMVNHWENHMHTDDPLADTAVSSGADEIAAADTAGGRVGTAAEQRRRPTERRDAPIDVDGGPLAGTAVIAGTATNAVAGRVDTTAALLAAAAAEGEPAGAQEQVSTVESIFRVIDTLTSLEHSLETGPQPVRVVPGRLPAQQGEQEQQQQQGGVPDMHRHQHSADQHPVAGLRSPTGLIFHQAVSRLLGLPLEDESMMAEAAADLHGSVGHGGAAPAAVIAGAAAATPAMERGGATDVTGRHNTAGRLVRLGPHAELSEEESAGGAESAGVAGRVQQAALQRAASGELAREVARETTAAVARAVARQIRREVLPQLRSAAPAAVVDGGYISSSTDDA